MHLKTVLFILLKIGLIQCFKSPPKFYPRILSRGVDFGQIGYYRKMTKLSFGDKIRIPNMFIDKEFGDWANGSELAKDYATMINNTYNYIAPPMDYYYFAKEKGLKVTKDLRNKKLLSKRRKRDMCSNWLGKAFLSLFTDNPCSGTTSEETKRALQAIVKTQDSDRQALQHVELSLGESEEVDRGLLEHMKKLDHIMTNTEQAIFTNTMTATQMRKDIYYAIVGITSLIGVSERFRTYAEILNRRHKGGIYLDMLPRAIRSNIRNKYEGSVMGDRIMDGTAMLLKPTFDFKFDSLTNGRDGKLVLQIEAYLPEVQLDCQVYKLERLGIESSGSCLSGQEYKDLLIIDCGSGQTWITTKSCLEDCDEIGVRKHVCFVNHCGADQQYKPSWLNDTHQGPLHVDSENLSFCKRQPTVVSVGRSQYLLTRSANVSYHHLDGSVEESIQEAGTLLKETCGRAKTLQVNDVDYSGSCREGDDSIDGRISIENHDDLTIVNFDDLDPGKENSTLQDELQGLIRELQDRSFADKVEIQQKRIAEMDHYIDADMVKMARNQKELVDHVKKIQEEKNPVSSSWTDKVWMITISVIAFTAFLMSACALMMVKPVGGITTIPIRNMKIRKRKRQNKPNVESEAEGNVEASAPMLPTDALEIIHAKSARTDPMMSQGTDSVDYRGSIVGKDLDRALSMREYDTTLSLTRQPNFFNMTTREVAEFVMNTMRPNGIYYYDNDAWRMLGRDRPRV